MSSLVTDERRTPRWFFELVSRVWGPFDLDACAAAWNAQCRRYVTREQDVFRRHPVSRRTWRNPPYSRGNLDKHLAHARETFLMGTTTLAYANLVPADPSTDWWKLHIARPEGRPLRADWLWRKLPDPLGNATRYVSEGLVTTVVLVDGRLPFDEPTKAQESGAMQPSALVVYERPGLVQTSGRLKAES